MSSNIGIIFHEDYLEHDTGTHPESRERLVRIMEHLDKNKLWGGIEKIQPRLAKVEEVKLVHPEQYINSIRDKCETGGGYLNMDTPVCKASFRAALRAVGGVLTAIDKVIDGELTRIFCAVRPPGHHAEITHSMGFCLFNNIAIGAKYAQGKHGIKKVLIVDWDCHHGNGVQHIFEKDPSTYYFSIHQFPHYPGTGAIKEVGFDKGLGTTLNVPLPPGSGDDEYLDALENQLQPVMDEWKPDLILISAGFDAHESDPLCAMNVTTQGFKKMTEIIIPIAEKHCQGKLVSVLEGGYDLEALALSVGEHLLALKEA